MFDKEFYPTPTRVIEMMTSGLDLSGKTVLEPSAGAGHIVDHARNLGARSVIACERNENLRRIVGGKCRILRPDFFDVTREEVSHIDFIIMNPPFSNADKHITHAWEVAPEGCQIIALCNAETIKNRWSASRTKLGQMVEKNGSWQDIGNAFSDAERTTDIDVAIIRLFKPKTGDNEFDGYFFNMSDTQEEAIDGSGVMKHNDIREIVNRYVAAVKLFDDVQGISTKINVLIEPISSGLGIAFGAHETYSRRGIQTGKLTREDFKKELQKSAWRSVFNKMNMEKYVTGSVMADINKFVEQQQAVPFTMENIYKVIEIVIGTNGSRMERVLVEVFDRICSLSSDNSEAGEKWKTNSNYKINRRFIDTYICEYDTRWPSINVKIRSGHRSELIDDITKALCFLTGKNYDQVMLMQYDNGHGSKYQCHKTLYNFFSYNKTDWGEWVQWNDFFRVRGYKKGTMHFEFVDENVWMEFNRRVAKIKGWALPQKTDTRHKGTEKRKKAGIVTV